MKPTSESNFQSHTQQGVVLVYFHAAWCSPCQSQEDVLTEIEEEYGESMSVFSLDVDHCGQLVHHHGIMSVPTLLLFQEGHVVERIIGLQSKKVLLELITPFLLE
ncbi:thioredoxin family protein [Tumebacillus sp. ITR2]|uniref:Thioredoxin n=1 Tax=Tumebacillus amylolyticus TaxID=2801339 RepID=A0ABS1JC23_9BACL|nr:thioredoxin family protein [Tumebacillus amylolyticus]MBL0387178.1 thioredoxin family protein [Tumebacillus amylolyticus]